MAPHLEQVDRIAASRQGRDQMTGGPIHPAVTRGGQEDGDARRHAHEGLAIQSSGSSSGAGLMPGCLDEDPVPDGELHHPEELPTTRSRGLACPHQLGDGLGPEPLLDAPIAGQGRADAGCRVAPQPITHGDMEPALGPIQMTGREPRARPILEQGLADAPTHLEPVRQGESELHQAMVEEGHPALQPEGHQHPVGLDQQIVRQRRDQIHVLAALQVRPILGGLPPGVAEGRLILPAGLNKPRPEQPSRPAIGPLSAGAKAPAARDGAGSWPSAPPSRAGSGDNRRRPRHRLPPRRPP